MTRQDEVAEVQSLLFCIKTNGKCDIDFENNVFEREKKKQKYKWKEISDIFTSQWFLGQFFRQIILILSPPNIIVLRPSYF